MQKRHHQTRNTVWVTLYCKKCARNTSHAVMEKRITHCLECGKPPPKLASGEVNVIAHACICPKHPFPHYHPDGQRYNLGAIDHRFQIKEKDQ